MCIYPANLYCVYLTVYSGSKLPPFYIGSTSIKNISNGYIGSVSSKEYKNIWKTESKKNPHLFTTKIISVCDSKEHSLEREEEIQIKLNVVRNALYVNKAVASKKFFFTAKHSQKAKDKISYNGKKNSKTRGVAPAYNNSGKYIGLINVNDKRWGTEIHGYNHFDPKISGLLTRINNERVKNGIHNFQGDSNPSRQRVKNGTHHWFSGSESRKTIDEYQRQEVRNGTHYWQSEEHKTKTSENGKKRIKEGTHPFTAKVICPHCNKTMTKASAARYHFEKCKYRS